MLSAPWVVGPITPCSKYVRVEGLLPRATVRLFRDEGLPIGKGSAQPAQMPHALIPLNETIKLEPGWHITATQEKDGEVSEPSPLPYRVLLHPTLESLEKMFFLAPPVQCGRCLALGGIVPGATVTLEVSGQLPVTMVADWTVVEIPIQGGISPGGVTGPITVSQRACADDRSAVMTFPPPLKLHTDGSIFGPPPKLPPPVLEPPPLARQQFLHLTSIQPGATVQLERGDGTVLTSCFGSTEGEILLPNDGLEPDEKLKLSQEYGVPEEIYVRGCRRSGRSGKALADPGRPEAPTFAARPCAGDIFTTVAGLVPGATVHLFRNDETQPFLVGAATRRVSAINLPGGWNAKRLSVRQAVRPEGPFSEASTARVGPAEPPLEPALGTLVECAAAVAVGSAGLNPQGGPIGLSAGTYLRVVSERWRGVIGEATALGDTYTNVDLWLPLVPGDRIRVQANRSGLWSAPTGVTIVEPEPPMLPKPELLINDGGIDDCTGAIAVDTIEPGVIVDVEEVPGTIPFGDTAGILLASVRAGWARRPLPVPPLEPKTQVRARTRRCGIRSDPSDAATVVDRGPVATQTVRVCQLTGGSDPAGRPHLNDTRGIALVGTDLGIAVGHGSKVWFFFGDAGIFHFGPFDFVDKAEDPFAWTEDEPEPDGPTLHFIAGDTDAFVELLEVTIGAVAGGILGTVIGALVTEVGVAGALLGGVTGAALGALVGWLIDIVPDKRFRRLAVDGLPALGLFEVPTGAFSFEDRVFLFVAREMVRDPWLGRMRVSHLARSVNADPSHNFKNLHNVSAMLRDIGTTKAPAHLKSADFPAGEWLVHVAPVRVRNAEWPGLPSDKGEGLLLFGTGLYRSSNVRLAWAPLTPGQLPPSPETWQFFMGAGKTWITAKKATADGVEPAPLLPDVVEGVEANGAPKPGLAELSVSWSPALRRWLMTSESGRIRFASRPQGPWTGPSDVFDGNDQWLGADNIAPDGSRVWVGVPWTENPTRGTVAYAPYLVPDWTRVDRSTREATIYYTLSVEHPPYNPQLLRSTLRGR